MQKIAREVLVQSQIAGGSSKNSSTATSDATVNVTIGS